MTENEKLNCAIYCEKVKAGIEVCEECDIYTMDDSACKDIAREAIKALEEVQEYRKLGTVEELKVAWKYVDLAKKHNTIGNVIESCAEYESIGTVEEVREAVGKDTAKKVIIKPWEPCKCPTCDKELSESVGDGYYKHYYYLKRCTECGQRLDWGD